MDVVTFVELDDSDKENGILEENVCFLCKKEFPPHKGKGKGKLKARKQNANNIDWVACDLCLHWFH